MGTRPQTLWIAFQNQRVSARRRGISFELTWEQWLDVWTKSGKLAQRGRRLGQLGQYVMARFGDKGPYKLGNIKIIKCEKNHREGTIGKFLGVPKSEEQKRKQSITMTGRKLTEEHKKNIGLGVKGKRKGIALSPEHKARISEVQSNRSKEHQDKLNAACRTPENRERISRQMTLLWAKRREERASG